MIKKLNAIIIHARANERFRTQVKHAVRQELLAHFTHVEFPSEPIVNWFSQDFELLCGDEQEVVNDKITSKVHEHRFFYFSF